MTIDLPSLSPCDALVAVMVAVSCSDSTIRTSELVAIQRMVDHAPVFAAYDDDRIRPISQTVMGIIRISRMMKGTERSTLTTKERMP